VTRRRVRVGLVVVVVPLQLLGVMTLVGWAVPMLPAWWPR
jgi:hypothetical protein